MRVQGVALEHHRQAALSRRRIVDAFAGYADFARADFLQSGDHAQQRRFAAAGRPHQDHEFAIPDGELDVAQNVLRFFSGVGLADAPQCDGCHVSSPLPSPPSPIP
jgi:hypothetical protein